MKGMGYRATATFIGLFSGFIGCGREIPTDGDTRRAIEARIEQQTQGRMALLDLRVTERFPRDSYYIIEYAGEVELLADARWLMSLRLVSGFRSGEPLPEDATSWDRWFRQSQLSLMDFRRGDVAAFEGRVRFERTERGWRVHNVSVYNVSRSDTTRWVPEGVLPPPVSPHESPRTGLRNDAGESAASVPRHRRHETDLGAERGDWLRARRIKLVNFPFEGDFGKAIADGVRRRIFVALDAAEYEAGHGQRHRVVQTAPLNRKALKVVLEAAEADPWVRRSHGVDRRPGGFRIHAEYGQVLGAVVYDDDRIDIIDPSGYVLWHDYNGASIDTLRRETGLPIIIGNLDRSPGEGERWDRDDVQAGITLALYLEDYPQLHRFEAIDVGGRFPGLGDVRLVLRTAEDGLIYWGSPPRKAQPGEPSANVKLARLSYIARNYQDFHRDGSRWELDHDLNAPYPRKRQ